MGCILRLRVEESGIRFRLWGFEFRFSAVGFELFGSRVLGFNCRA